MSDTSLSPQITWLICFTQKLLINKIVAFQMSNLVLRIIFLSNSFDAFQNVRQV